MESVDKELAKPLAFDDETFGTDPAAVDEQRAMIELAGGGPAPLRDPNRPRPRRAEEVAADGD